MVIHDFDRVWASWGPSKANPVLLIDPNAMLPSPISLKGLEMSRPETLLSTENRPLAGSAPARG